MKCHVASLTMHYTCKLSKSTFLHLSFGWMDGWMNELMKAYSFKYEYCI